MIADIRLRLIATLVLVLAISQVHALWVAVIALISALMLAFLARLKPATWRRLLHIELFVLLLFLTLPFAVSGSEVFALGPLVASMEGLQRATLVALRISAALTLIMALLGDLQPEDIAAGLSALRLPEPLVRLFLLTVRYLWLLRAEAQRLHDAMRARAFRPGSNRHTWRSYGYFIGMLLVRALDRAQRVEEAMRLRGFAGRFPHPALPAPRHADWVVFGLAFMTAAGLLVGSFS